MKKTYISPEIRINRINDILTASVGLNDDTALDIFPQL